LFTPAEGIGQIIDLHNVRNADVIVLPGAFPVRALYICTGTAAFDFRGDKEGINTAMIRFPIPSEPTATSVPDESDVDSFGFDVAWDPFEHPLDFTEVLRDGGVVHEATVASIASFTGDTGPWAVDRVEAAQADPNIFIQALLAVGHGSDILRVAYQCNLLIRVE